MKDDAMQARLGEREWHGEGVVRKVQGGAGGVGRILWGRVQNKIKLMLGQGSERAGALSSHLCSLS